MADLPTPLLRTFVVVAETLNLTAAAARLHRAPSTISMQINRLEDLVQTPLLQRGQYGVRLTLAGEQLRPRVQQLLALHDRILGEFQNADISGRVRFGTHDLHVTRLLPPLLESYRLSYPEAELKVICDHRPGYLAAQVADGQLDIALVEMPALSDGGRRLSQDQLIWVSGETLVVDPQHPLPLALFPEDCFYRDAAIEALQRQDIPFRTAFTSHSRAGVIAAIRAGLGVGVLPQSALEEGLRPLPGPLPPLPAISTTLFVAEQANLATRRLAQAIEECPLLQSSRIQPGTPLVAGDQELPGIPRPLEN